MKKIKIDLDDLLIVLEAMQDQGTKEVLIFEYQDQPAIADADDRENIISFQAVTSEDDPEDQVH
jgi:hypothetical protein